MNIKSYPEMKNNKSDKALQKLLGMELDQRIETIFSDVISKEDKYKCIEPIELAKALGVPLDKLEYSFDFDTREYWLFYKYAELGKVEQYFCNSTLLDDIEILKGQINRKRYNELVKFISEKKIKKKAIIGILSNKEKELIIRTMAKNNLENDDCCYIAYHSVYTKDKKELCFAVDEDLFINDNDGIYTPYDKRDGKFVDLKGNPKNYLFTFLNDK